MPGDRAELIGELRRLGPKYSDAADALGVAVRFSLALPGVYAANIERREVITRGADDVAVWAALTQVLAADLGIEADMSTCLEVGAVMCRKSGIFSALRFG
jgi:hypothetical protein